MKARVPEATAFAEAIEAQGRAIRRIASMGAARGAVVCARLRRASEKASEKVDAIIDASVLRPDAAAAAGLIAEELLEHLRQEAAGAARPEEAQALRAVLGKCRPQAEALVHVRLDTKTHPTRYGEVFARLERLRALLDDPIAWQIALRRLAALARLREETWRALEHAPCWAVVRALGRRHGSDTEYLLGLETLAPSLGRWAAPHAAGAAERARVLLAAPPHPARIEALLRAWPWPHAMPPLPAVAACAEIGRSALSTDEWAAAITLESVPEPVRAQDISEEIDALAPKLRAIVEEAIEREATERLADLFLDVEERRPTRSERETMLHRMRALWAANRHLAPKEAHEHTLRVETSGLHELMRPALRWVPPSLEGAVHELPALVWHIPDTSPERALVGSTVAAADAGAHRAFALCRSAPGKVVQLPRMPGWEAHHPAFDDRAEAIDAIIERLVAEFGSVGRVGPKAEEGAHA